MFGIFRMLPRRTACPDLGRNMGGSVRVRRLRSATSRSDRGGGPGRLRRGVAATQPPACAPNSDSANAAKGAPKARPGARGGSHITRASRHRERRRSRSRVGPGVADETILSTMIFAPMDNGDRSMADESELFAVAILGHQLGKINDHSGRHDGPSIQSKSCLCAAFSHRKDVGPGP